MNPTTIPTTADLHDEHVLKNHRLAALTLGHGLLAALA